MYERILTALAIFGQFLALFPFVVTAEAAGFGGYTWWHYFVMYAGAAGFWLSGRLLSCWAKGGGFSRKVKPFVMFLSRVGVIVPGAVFCVIGGLTGAHTGLYLYFLPGCIAAYYAGYLAVGKDYSDIFTRGWFAVYFVAAVISAILVGFTHDDGIISAGMAQLCVSFGVMMITAAILTNQTNIDMQTRQRSGNHAVLPRGVRSYNAKLIGLTGAVIVGACLFAKPLGSALGDLLKMLLGFLLSLIHGSGEEGLEDGDMSENTAEQFDYDINSNALAQLFIYVLVIVFVVLAVKYRRQIWAFIKSIFAPLFRVNIEEPSSPFVDEFSASTDKRSGSRSLGRSERDLLKSYRRETDPVLKYRRGYELFLSVLGRSAFPQLPTDTTTVHCGKGEKAFCERIDSERLEEMIKQYDRVRYGGEIPDSRSLEQLDRILSEIR